MGHGVLSSVLILCVTLFGLVRGAELRPEVGRSSTVVRNGVKMDVFEHFETGAKLEFVTNSGVCETTPNVKQYSGYISVGGTGMNMWFWFFEARNNSKTAPMAAWFNGGPGCSSMIGLFQENGPCTFNNGEPIGKPSKNPHSFNNNVNMLYIDQPLGVGFSYGADNVDSTTTAAPLVHKLLQAFYVRFPEYKSRDFGIFTESYGGHYGPGFAKYILDQNEAIAKGKSTGQHINLVALGVNNAWIDPYDNYMGMIDFAVNNTYKKLINSTRAAKLYDDLKGKCASQLQACNKEGNTAICARSVMTCKNAIEMPLTMINSFDVYDVRKPATIGPGGSRLPSFPPQTYEKYLQMPEIQSMIGASRKYNECPRSVQTRFLKTGDDSRTYLPVIEEVVNKNVTTVIWAGDADFICNWLANQYTANNLKYKGHDKFKSTSLKPYTVNGKEKGSFKTVDNLSFLRAYNAGHTVMAFQPELSLQVFEQTMMRRPLYST